MLQAFTSRGTLQISYQHIWLKKRKEKNTEPTSHENTSHHFFLAQSLKVLKSISVRELASLKTFSTTSFFLKTLGNLFRWSSDRVWTRWGQPAQRRRSKRGNTDTPLKAAGIGQEKKKNPVALANIIHLEALPWPLTKISVYMGELELLSFSATFSPSIERTLCAVFILCFSWLVSLWRKSV